jgi:hypothetical protein
MPSANACYGVFRDVDFASGLTGVCKGGPRFQCKTFHLPLQRILIPDARGIDGVRFLRFYLNLRRNEKAHPFAAELSCVTPAYLQARFAIRTR